LGVLEHLQGVSVTGKMIPVMRPNFVTQEQEGIMSFQKRVQLAAIALLIGVIGIGLNHESAGAETQDISGFDRRISMLEQRFYMLETSLNRLQQSVSSQRSTGSSSSDLRDRQVDELRGELQRLQIRLNEVECGLVKLDERTATAGGKARNGEARPGDPCRLNPGTPLRLPTRSSN
jgi:hypothetical protein